MAATTQVHALGLVVALLLVGCGHNGEDEPAIPTGQSINFDHQHTAFGKILRAIVRNGLVDYSSLPCRLPALRRYLNLTAQVPRKQFNGWTSAQRLAFLINIYNATTLKLISEEKSGDSIKSIGGIRSPWKLKIVRLFGEKWSLDTLEHEWIRKEFQSPQIHFALVCGARSCPPLRKEPFTANNLEEQFSDQARLFLEDTQKNRIDLEKRIVHLSEIFKWYKRDFGKTDLDLLRFIAPSYPPEIRDKLLKGNFQIKYLKYDWSINQAQSGK